jgi:hypothetical protein
MQLDLNNVDSIVAWWRVWPGRHDSYLDYKAKASPEFAHSIGAARRLIAADPELQRLRRQSAQERRRQRVAEAWPGDEPLEAAATITPVDTAPA